MRHCNQGAGVDTASVPSLNTDVERHAGVRVNEGDAAHHNDHIRFIVDGFVVGTNLLESLA